MAPFYEMFCRGLVANPNFFANFQIDLRITNQKFLICNKPRACQKSESMIRDSNLSANFRIDSRITNQKFLIPYEP